jgi:hypothetical protein
MLRLIRLETPVQRSFEFLFLLSMIVPVAAVVVGAAALFGATLLNRQRHTGDAGVSQPGGLGVEQPVAH